VGRFLHNIEEVELVVRTTKKLVGDIYASISPQPA